MTTYYTARDAEDSWDDDARQENIRIGYDMPLDEKALIWLPVCKSQLVSLN